MIIGSGLLARTFEPYFGTNSETTIFASGVSNSLETRITEFDRERSLLCELLETGATRVVYFSSCGVVTTDSDPTPYMEHKRLMESLVLASTGGLVLRLPQVVGITDNPHTLTNFIRDRILAGDHFTVWQYAERNLIDVDDLEAIGTLLIKETPSDRIAVISIAAERSIPMPEIVGMFERILQKQANYSMAPKGQPLVVETQKASEAGAKLGINLGADYIEGVIRKYYAAN